VKLDQERQYHSLYAVMFVRLLVHYEIRNAGMNTHPVEYTGNILGIVQ